MTGQELIKKLADDCDLTRSRAEDILLSIKDIVLAEITAKRTAVLPGLGRFCAVNGGARPVRFRFDEELFSTLNIDSKVHVASCVKCGERAPVKGRRKCRPCLTAEDTARGRKKRLAAKHAKGAK